MKIIVEGEKIISVGQGPYFPEEGQEEFEILYWNGKRKKENKWKNGQVVEKTPEEIVEYEEAEEADRQAEVDAPIRAVVLQMVVEEIIKDGKNYVPPE